ncbi:MAG: Inner membrane amino-acid ABC transporter permease protein YecS [Syntrophorhabdaceae bacterium PtaU1.Bin034]|nr:MAG: Inner membrane amino-acid ABC transporter permease protein YecS [Syntrophorhabdaceae bacterium PtaU1.Bin034]
MGSFINDITAFMPQILNGLKNTVMLMAIISVTGFLGGIAVFYMKINGGRISRRMTGSFISFFIGTPLLVHLFLMYYGLPQLGIRMSPLAISVIGFTLNVSAYNAHYLMTAFNGLDAAEIEAARAQGFTTSEIFFFIILPQVLRFSVPSLTNQIIQNLKDTSVAFLIQYQDFFVAVQELAATNFEFFRAYTMAGFVYLAMVSVIVLGARRLERHIILPGFGS